LELDRLRELHREVLARVGSVVVGQEENIHLLMVCLLARGHVLLEGVPGIGKTLLARTFAACTGLEFKRIQFTPDLMPGDVVGTNVFDFQRNAFTLSRGPIFTEVLLADEINRTPPKTQAALLEAMQERQVTLDGRTHPLSDGFLVVATQNPIEHEGTYPLPEAQLDRFLLKLVIRHPERADEVELVLRHGARDASLRFDERGVGAVCDLETLSDARRTVAAVTLAEPIAGYVVDVVRATRTHADLQVGASPRAAVVLTAAARASAALDGRDYVIPDDVKALLAPVLRHRVVVAPGAEIEGRTAEQVVASIIARTEAPR
jgi:MoxR-like ATPase